MCLPHVSEQQHTTAATTAVALVQLQLAAARKQSSLRRSAPGKKRVRFEEPNSESSSLRMMVCGAKRPRDFITAAIEGQVRQMTEDEKAELWFRGDERAEIHRRLSRDAHEARIGDNKMILLGQPHFCFRDTYANVFAACHLIVGHDDDDMCSIVSPEIFTFMATNDARGLEDRTAPRVALERRLLRARQIQLVLQVQRTHDPEGVRDVSRALSRPSRKLAEALGIIDATAAMMLYTTQSCEPETSATPPVSECPSIVKSLNYDGSQALAVLCEGRLAAAC